MSLYTYTPRDTITVKELAECQALIEWCKGCGLLKYGQDVFKRPALQITIDWIKVPADIQKHFQFAYSK